MIIIGICLLVLGPSCITLTEGCGRVPATPAPTVPPTPTQPTINGSVRSVECTSAEKNKTACLNEGTCFVLILDEERVANCHCTKEYMGTRCEELNVDVIFPSVPENPTATAGIAASIAVLVIIVIVFTGVAVVYYRKKKQERKRMAQKHLKQQNGANGSLLPENHIQPPNPDFHFNGNGNLIMEEKKLMLPGYKTTPV